ncbi:MAG: D-2-hydroxyacid dehydrogenase [Actinomycetota bacterium]
MNTPPEPLDVLVIKTLTLPDVSAEEEAMIAEAAGPGASVTVVDGFKPAVEYIGAANALLGILPKQLLDAASELKWVHATASGVDMFMYDEFLASDIVLTGEKGLVGGHLADTAFGLLLALTRRIKMAIQLGPDGWSSENRQKMRFAEIELAGLTMGIVGFGGTGRHMARRAVAFGMDVQAVDAFSVAASDGVDEVWGLDRLDEVVATSDVLAVGLPLTDETRGMCNDDFFARMKDTAILVNVTRGEIIDGPALERALTAGTIGGAALDVAPVEPLPADSPLWHLDNCVMTPHTAGASQHRARRNIERFCRNLVALREGGPMEGVVDLHAGF